jgi:tRNA threonylcarbamoyladenosine biosynthesis protein TsaE
MSAISLPDSAATEAFGRSLAERIEPGDVIALFGPLGAGKTTLGPLGAGKTTLARGILNGLGHSGEVASPTFPIVLPYDPPDTRVPVWHVDLYRIEEPSELDELGLEEARPEVALLIEWPERLPHLWHESLRLTLEPRPDGSRALTAMVPPAWGKRWPTQ